MRKLPSVEMVSGIYVGLWETIDIEEDRKSGVLDAFMSFVAPSPGGQSQNVVILQEEGLTTRNANTPMRFCHWTEWNPNCTIMTMQLWGSIFEPIPDSRHLPKVSNCMEALVSVISHWSQQNIATNTTANLKKLMLGSETIGKLSTLLDLIRPGWDGSKVFRAAYNMDCSESTM